MIIQTETFTPTEGDKGTVEVTLGKRTERVEAYRYDIDGQAFISVYRAFSGRYRTGGKAWPARVSCRQRAGGAWVEYVDFGRDDRSSRFNKAQGLFWAI